MKEQVTAPAIGFALFLAIAVTWAAIRAGFYRLPAPIPPYRLYLREVVGAFATYLLFAFIILPGAVLLIAGQATGTTIAEKIAFRRDQLIGLQVGAFFLIFLALIGYLFLIRKESREQILWWGKREGSVKKILFGILTLAISYPVVLFVNLSLNYLTEHFFGRSGIEQNAVRQLKTMTNMPFFFTLMALVVIFIVPFVEEVLFRGFLQTYLRRYLGRFGAILLTAIIFSLAHYVRGGGVGNIELITSLFILACYLGYLYERERSLFAPYGLHLAFNASTILAIAWS